MNNQRVNFIIDKDNNVVVAEINNCYNDAMELLNHKFVKNVTSRMFVLVDDSDKSKLAMNGNYRAVARLHPDDEWDETRGKNIACDKLTEKYHHSMNKRLALYADNFRKIANEIDAYLESKNFQKIV